MDEFLDMAEELDGMDRSLNTWEANFLNGILALLRKNQPLSPGRETKLREIHEKYLGGETDASEGDDDALFM